MPPELDMCPTAASPAVLHSPRTPSQGGAHRIIPDQAHGRTGYPRYPPIRVLLGEQRRRDSDIRDRSKAADQCER